MVENSGWKCSMIMIIIEMMITSFVPGIVNFISFLPISWLVCEFPKFRENILFIFMCWEPVIGIKAVEYPPEKKLCLPAKNLVYRPPHQVKRTVRALQPFLPVYLKWEGRVFVHLHLQTLKMLSQNAAKEEPSPSEGRKLSKMTVKRIKHFGELQP